MEELPVMSVAVYTEMPVPPTKTNRGRNHSVLQARKRSHQICCAAEFLFSAPHTGLVRTMSFHTGVSSQTGEITEGKENAQHEEHRIPRKQASCDQNMTGITV